MAPSRPRKISLDQLVHLVEQLPANEQELLRQKLNRNAESHPGPGGEPHPFLDWHIDIESLAAQQCAPASTSVEGLKGDFWPAGEDLEEFVSTVRQWRRECSGR